MPKYNHAFTIAFTLETDCDCEGDNYPTNQELRHALLDRIKDLDRANQYEEAIGYPFDTYEIPQDDQTTD